MYTWPCQFFQSFCNMKKYYFFFAEVRHLISLCQKEHESIAYELHSIQDQCLFADHKIHKQHQHLLSTMAKCGSQLTQLEYVSKYILAEDKSTKLWHHWSELQLIFDILFSLYYFKQATDDKYFFYSQQVKSSRRTTLLLIVISSRIEAIEENQLLSN